MIAVTKLIGLLDKPGLVYWANKIGLNGVSLKEHRLKSTNDGTDKHNKVEKYLTDGILFDGYHKLKKQLVGFDVIGCEVEIKNEYLIGRADLILEKESKKYIIDFKSSKDIYLSTKLQLSTYKHLYKADIIAVMDLEDFNITILNIDTNKYYEIIKRLYQVNELLEYLREKL